MIRLLGDEIDLNGAVVATLVPELSLSLRDALTWPLDTADEDYVGQLEDRLEQLEAWLKETAR